MLEKNTDERNTGTLAREHEQRADTDSNHGRGHNARAQEFPALRACRIVCLEDAFLK